MRAVAIMIITNLCFQKKDSVSTGTAALVFELSGSGLGIGFTGGFTGVGFTGLMSGVGGGRGGFGLGDGLFPGYTFGYGGIV